LLDAPLPDCGLAAPPAWPAAEPVVTPDWLLGAGEFDCVVWIGGAVEPRLKFELFRP
jgi:hypothetical protein